MTKPKQLIMTPHNKYLIPLIVAMFFATVAGAQVNGFAVGCPGSTQTSGTSFPVNLSFNWTNTTTSATVTLNYNTSLVTYDPSCQSVLPSCMTVSNNSVTGVLTVSIANLSACTNTGAISFNVCFQFKCPDTCAGVNKNATFNGTLTDNLSTTKTASCSVTGNTPNSWVLNHYFHSYNSITAEVTYKVYYYDPTCFRVKNPKFNVALTPTMCGGTITSAWGLNYIYTVSGTTITPNVTAYNQYNWDTMYYVVKLPCNTCLNQTLTSNITLLGDNCNVPNSNIKGPVPASYTIPAAPLPNPQATIQKWVLTAPNRFRTRITNTGNTPLNLIHDDYIPLVHVTNAPSVIQYTNQGVLTNTVQYYDCSNVAGPTYTIAGNAATNSNAPANTKRIRYTINNLLPGSYVDEYTYFDLSSSCSGPVGNPPYRDSSVVSYNCFAPPGSCIACSPGAGTLTGVVVYNPQPILQCVSTTQINTCHNVGDTLDFCYEFKNVGDAALLGGIFNAQLPGWLQYLPGSATYTGFSPNPTYISATNAKFNLPTIPVGNGVYKICFKAVVNAGAVGGTNWFWTTATGSNAPSAMYICWSSFNICAFAAIGVEKKVKGSLDGSFGTSGNGVAGSMATYEVTLRNTGTIPVDNLDVIDRIPFPINTPVSDLYILGSPCGLRGSQFNMLMGPTPVVPGATVSYSNDPNVCLPSTWLGVCTTCGPPAVGTWSGSGNKAIRFLFNPANQLAPGASITFTFQLQIPPGTTPGLHACNTVGFNAKPISAYSSFTLNAVESNNVCIEVHEGEAPPPTGCCKDLLKTIKETHTVSNDVLNVNLTLAAGPRKLKKVTVSLAQFEVRHPADCDVCVKDPKYFGNIVPGNNTLPWNTVPASVPFTHEIYWQDSSGLSWNNGIPVNLSIPLPPRSLIACCCDTIYYCLRYTFTDTACIVCDTTICYKTYNGKDCKETGGGGNNNPVCNCSFKPLFQYESNGGQTGSKNVTCGDVINLFAGSIFTSVIPNFQCKDQFGKDCEAGAMTVVIKKPDNTTQTLTGPTYNYTYTLAMPGTYEYTISATCAGKKCECKFQVVIPQH